jgi:tRNA dimethylallyltransferase
VVTGGAPLVVIAGATGVGKTATAVALAAKVPMEVISADSRQIYRGMDVGTGKPTPAERAAVRHRLIDIAEPDDRYNAARFRADALEAIEAVRREGRVPVIVGGTGLYIRALLRGLDPAPPADPCFRAELTALAAEAGREALYHRLRREAPSAAARLHPNDSVRIIRALELVRADRTDQRAWRTTPAPMGPVFYVGLSMDRGLLADRLRARCRGMVAAGLAGEVERLLERGYDVSLPAMHGIGYRDFARVLRGQATPEEALHAMQRDTLRYAKRQMTWFRREPDIEWIDIEREGGPAGVAALVEARLE